MTRHLDEGLLQGLLDEELGNGEEQGTREHLAGCPTCRVRYAEVRESNHVLASALALLDPSVDGAGVAQLPPPSTRAPRVWGRSGMVRAAAMLLTFAAAASATIPGSPLRDWLASTWSTPVPGATTVQPTAAAAATPAETAETGVGVELAADRFEVVLIGAAPDLQIRALLVERSRGAVYATGAAIDARFATAPGSIRVEGLAGGELRVEIPEAAAVASIVIDGRRFVEKEGNQLRLLSGDDAPLAEILFRVGP